ncbi:extracellular solute-binding protein, partial [Rhizobium leguminosarum]|uniref:extracellular solute-binding protein n=1 Tax=Rhizobium leguminosarum TaxID=384 RepID=UPI003F991A17
FRAAQKQSDKPLLTAPIPKGTDKRISHLGGRALGINPNTKHHKEAWEFVKYLVGPETFKT